MTSERSSRRSWIRSRSGRPRPGCRRAVVVGLGRPKLAWRLLLAIGAAVLVLVAALAGGRQLASLRERTAASPGVVAGKAIYLSPSFNGSGWIQIDPVTLQDVSGKPLLDIPPTAANTDDTTVSADGSTIIVGEFSPTGVRRAVYDGGTGQLRGVLMPEVSMVIDRLSADGRMAIGRLGSNLNRLTDPKAIVSVDTGRVIRNVVAGPQLWTVGVLYATDLTTIYYIVTRVPLSETGLDVSVQQPLFLVAQSTVDGSLSEPVALPGMTMGNLLTASPPRSVSASATSSPDGRQLAFLSYDGMTLDLVDTRSLLVTTRNVHQRSSLWDPFSPLVAQAKEFIDQQVRNVQYTPDGSALLVMVVDIHYGGESPVRTTRTIQRVEVAAGEITAEIAPTGGVYSMTVSPDGAALYLVVRTQEPPNAVYVLRRLDARTLELKTERALSDYVELHLVAAPADRVARPAPTPPNKPSATDPGAGLGPIFDLTPAYPGYPWTRDGHPVKPEELGTSAGPAHCGWESATFLTIGWPVGTLSTSAARSRQYIRDPRGVVRPALRDRLDLDATLPSDAHPTGYVYGSIQIYVSASDEDSAIYVVGPTGTERWPRSEPMSLCR